MKTIYFSIIAIFISVNAISQSIPPADSCALYVNGKTHYYGVWPGCNSTYTSCDNGCLYKPVILLNGFDPDSHRHLYVPDDDCLTDDGMTLDTCIYCVANEHGMAESLRSAGYDIVILDFADLDVIRKQADVLQALIIELKQKMQECDNQHEFVVIGPSSGGLVSRYALAEMEQDNIDHNTRLYISFDAPHQGANLPLSLQFLINFMHGVEDIDAINEMYNYLHSEPTSQLLIYKASVGTGQLVNQNFTDFFDTISSLNDCGYPEFSRNVAISNGSSNSTNQGYFQNQKLFKVEGNIPLLAKLTLEGWSVPNQNNEIVFSGKYRRLLNVYTTTNHVDNCSPIDIVPGGKSNFISQLVLNLDGPIEVEENIIFNIEAECVQNDCDDQFECFIPTISSLDLQNTDDYFYNVKANITGNDDLAFKGIDYNGDVSPFDAMCISEENEWHVINGVTDLIAGFVEDEIMPGQYFLQNQLITRCTDYSSLDYIKMGNYVTDRKPQGEFVFGANSGVSDVVARNRVVMEPGSKLVPTGNAKIRLYTDDFSNCSFISNRSFPVVPGLSQNIDSDVNNGLKIDSQDVFVNVYPNPFHSSFSLEIHSDFGQKVQLQIINMQGNIVLSREIILPLDNAVFTTEISAENLKSGMYVLQLLSDKEHATIQIIKQ